MVHPYQPVTMNVDGHRLFIVYEPRQDKLMIRSDTLTFNHKGVVGFGHRKDGQERTLRIHSVESDKLSKVSATAEKIYSEILARRIITDKGFVIVAKHHMVIRRPYALDRFFFKSLTRVFDSAFGAATA